MEPTQTPPTERSYVRIPTLTFVMIVVALLAGLLGWWIGHRQTSTANPQTPTATGASATNYATGVKSLVTYELPDGWKEATCAAAPGTVFVAPSPPGTVDCNSNPTAPIKIAVDPANYKDCNQLQSIQNVSKHTCISEYINGHKSLKSETRYNSASSFKQDTTVDTYYIDTGKGVVKVEYIFTNDNAYQAGWEELAKSVAVN